MIGGIEWAAGFLEGDGSFQYSTMPNGRVRVFISASQIDAEPLEHLQYLFDGNIHRAGITKGGNQVWEWRLEGPAAIALLAELLPYLSQHKAARVNAALSAWNDWQTLKRPTAARLTLEQVREIRVSDDQTRTLAERYGASKNTVRRIRNGSAWKAFA